MDWEARANTLESALLSIRVLVDKQAEDEALWSVPLERVQPIGEAYLQQELRRLHGFIEGNLELLGINKGPSQ